MWKIKNVKDKQNKNKKNSLESTYQFYSLIRGRDDPIQKKLNKKIEVNSRTN